MIDIDDLRPWLGSDASQDAMVEDLEARIVDTVQRMSGRYFGPVASTTEILCGDGGMKLRLAEIPDSLPATITERAYPGADPTAITASADDGYELRTLTDPAPNLAWLVRKNGGVWVRGYEYTVQYDRGYATDGEPGQIRQLVLNLVQQFWEVRKAKGGVMQSETFDRYSYRLGESSASGLTLPDWAMDIVGYWQRPVW